jgi:hypothetical protein
MTNQHTVVLFLSGYPGSAFKPAFFPNCIYYGCLQAGVGDTAHQERYIIRRRFVFFPPNQQHFTSHNSVFSLFSFYFFLTVETVGFRRCFPGILALASEEH